MAISSGVIGASTTQIWKPDPNLDTVGAGDPFAPFPLGMIVTLEDPDFQLGQFCRVGSDGVSSGDTVAIIEGVTDTVTANNVWTNNTGVDLVEGDYAFLLGTVINAVGS